LGVLQRKFLSFIWCDQIRSIADRSIGESLFNEYELRTNDGPNDRITDLEVLMQLFSRGLNAFHEDRY
jgi:hypothetical protein